MVQLQEVFMDRLVRCAGTAFSQYGGMTPLERIRLAQKPKMSRDKLADLVGTSAKTIQRLENGERKLTREWAEQIAPHLGVDWLELMAEIEQIKQVALKNALLVPIVGKVAAGVWRESEDFEPDSRNTVPVYPDPRHGQTKQFALKVTGVSMDRTVSPGAYVICVPFAEVGRDPKDGELVIVKRTRGGLTEHTLKRYKINGNSPELWPESTHPDFQEPIPLAHTDEDTEVTITGIVVGRYYPEDN